MSKKVEMLLIQAEKLLYQLKNSQAFTILQNIEKMSGLSEEDQLRFFIVKIRYLIFTGAYEKALKLSIEVFDESDFNKHIANEFQLKHLNIMCLRANALWRLGRCDESLMVIQYVEEILEGLTFKDPSFYRVMANVLAEKAITYTMQGKMSQALVLSIESLSLNEKYGNLIGTSILLNRLGLIYKDLGDPGTAINYFNRCISICKEIVTRRPMHFAKANLATMYTLQGDLNLARELYLENISILEETGDIFNLSEAYEHIGRVYQLMGDFDSALEHLSKALQLAMELGNTERQSKILYRLVILTVEIDLLKQAQEYLQQLQKINLQEKNKLIDKRCRFSYALVFGIEQRARNLARAQDILKEIAQDEVIDDELTISALINLCKLLLKESQLFGSKNAVLELRNFSEFFFEKAKKQKSYVLLTEAYILQSRIALIDWDTRKAKEYLTQASQIAREKNLGKLLLEINREQGSLVKRIEIGEKYQLQKSSLRERVKLAQLDDIITRIVHSETSEIIKQKEELSDFAHQMAHDLRRNITNILGFAELIKNRGYDQHLVNIIVNNLKTMRDLLIHSVELAEAGLIVQTIDEVDLNHLVESVALMHLPPDIILTHNDLPTLVCDRNKINQIFKNLFENAVTHGVTTNTISVTRIDHKDGITLLISNDGIPIPKDLSNEIFQRGYTTKKGNTGLGLTIVKKLVEAHGWEISLDPVPSTTFKISIPIRFHTEIRSKAQTPT